MSKVRVLDKKNVDAIMAEKDITPQKLYNLFIPGGTLGVTGRLRIQVVLNRIVEPIEECKSTACLVPCPITEPTHIDSGFGTISLGTGHVVDRARFSAFYRGNQSGTGVITKFDLINGIAPLDSAGSGPSFAAGLGLDQANGNLYGLDTLAGGGLGRSAIVQINPDTLAVMQSGGNLNLNQSLLQVGQSVVFTLGDAATFGEIRCFNRSDLAQRFGLTISKVSNNPFAVDASENAWFIKSITPTTLAKCTKDGAITDFDISAHVTSTSPLGVVYESNTNTVVVATSNELLKVNAAGSVVDSFAPAAPTFQQFQSGANNGRFWYSQGGILKEFDVAQFDIVQSITLANLGINGASELATMWQDWVHLGPDCNALHCNHEAWSQGGRGVDVVLVG